MRRKVQTAVYITVEQKAALDEIRSTGMPIAELHRQALDVVIAAHRAGKGSVPEAEAEAIEVLGSQLATPTARRMARRTRELVYLYNQQTKTLRVAEAYAAHQRANLYAILRQVEEAVQNPEPPVKKDDSQGDDHA